MGTAEVAGSIGLTFFCNKCVEVFYRFRHEQVDEKELASTCNMAQAAFESLKAMGRPSSYVPDKYGLFDTNEEVLSFARAVRSGKRDAAVVINTLINDLVSLGNQQNSAEDRRAAAKNLQEFFDTLGDYSYVTTRESVRRSLAARDI